MLVLAACGAPQSEPAPVATAPIGSVSPPPPSATVAQAPPPAPAKSDFVAVEHPPAPPAGPPRCGPNAVPRPAPAKTVDRPVGAPDPSSIPNAPPVANADRVVAAMRPKFRRCYAEGLKLDPALEGRVTVTAWVDTNGCVESATPKREGLTEAVSTCIVDAIKTAEFEPPDRKVAINIPVRFVQAKDGGAP